MADQSAPNPSGSNEPQTTADDVRDVMDPGEPYGTKEIADLLDLPHSTANYRLNKLADGGVIRKKKPGHRTVVWIRPVDGGKDGD
jgi:Fic family protein